MKKLLLVALFLALPSAARAITYQSVRASTSTTLNPGLQVGTMNLSSATIQNVNVTYGVKASTFVGNGSGLTNISASAILPGSTNYINATSTLQSGATFYTSSGTVVNFTANNSTINNNNVTSTWLLNGQAGTLGQSVQSAGTGAIPTWVNVPSAILSTTSTWTATQTLSSATIANVTATTGTFANAYISSMTSTLPMSGRKITGLANGSSSTDGAAYGQLKFIQYVSSTSVGNTSTTNTAFQATTLSLSITPTSASNKILLYLSGTLGETASANESIVTFGRGGSNILGTRGCAEVTGLTNVTVPASCVYLDSPATTSSTSYSVMLRTSNGANTASFGSNDGTNMLTNSLIAIEVAP